ncbi:Arylsulfatase [Anaerohalosphaera lusitana]|uniref:Arylsulfatase n=1 Tax=Anaerohalosphaera lusitana TaxID=1936003 RepID=A0A1U9NQ25_9BACT|nr:sulfatase [Anaerohalosphaera lusitana]AQT69925.1 Arylsulfatase [Anaerohalosphaera lusitana]
MNGSISSRRWFLKQVAAGVAVFPAARLIGGVGEARVSNEKQSESAGAEKASRKRPNILLAISDDHSYPHASAYGCEFVNTPSFDEVARVGVLMKNAFCPAPQCSPSRASLLTGRNIWQNEEAGTHGSYFPKNWPVYTELLEQAGYHVGYTGKPWGPGDWRTKGWDKNPVGRGYNKAKLKERPTRGISYLDYAENFNLFLGDRDPDQPFCFWYGGFEPHRFYEYGSGEGERDDVDVPGYLPDNETVRTDLLDYAREIEHFDDHLGRIIEKLKEIGEWENTLVVVTGDNGMPFPRAKANVYAAGIHVPMAVCWAGEVPARSEMMTDFVSFIDLAPTFLEAAGQAVPDTMSGRSFLAELRSGKAGRVDASRGFAVAGRERHTHARADNVGYPARSIQTDEYLYIRNFKPERWPMGNPRDPYDQWAADIDGGPSKKVVLEDPESKFYELAVAKRPAEELYDLSKDPDCVDNIADDPKYANVKSELWERLKGILAEQEDPRVMGNGDVFDSYPRMRGTMRKYPGFKKREYNPEFMK